MFFITPERSIPVNHIAHPLVEIRSEVPDKRKYDEAFNIPNCVDSYYPKRNQRACDRCRLRKAKCTGGDVCEKCRRDGVICTTNRSPKNEQKPPSATYVQMVESQRDLLIQTLQKLSKSQDNSKPDLEKIIRELHMPSSAGREEREPSHRDLPTPINSTAPALTLQDRHTVGSEPPTQDPSQELHGLSNELLEMDNWLQLWDDPWDPSNNLFQTTVSSLP